VTAQAAEIDEATLALLTDEVRELLLRPKAMQAHVLDTLGTTIANMRDEAVKARKDSGIEDTWRECEEAYLGIDDLNRSEFEGARWAKPMTMDGGLRRERTRGQDETKATAFVKLTARYVDAGTSKVCEIALPADGKAFTLKATPVPEMDAAKDSEQPAQEITGQPMPDENGQPVTVGALAKNEIERAESAAEKAANRIHDWMVEYKHPAEMRKVVFDMARIGVGVVCGPIPDSKRVVVVRRVKPAPAAVDPAVPPEVRAKPVAAAAALSVEIVDQVKPVARWVDPWKFYPAPGCGEDIHNGDHCFEVDDILEGQLARLADRQDLFYIKDRIAKVLLEGPNKVHVDSGNTERKPIEEAYQIWHMRGSMSRAEFEAANPEQASKLDKALDRVNVVVSLVNDTVIRAIQSPTDSGRLPYHVGCWSRRAGHWAGIGVGEQVRTPQRIVNAATRAMLNNAAKSSGSNVVMDPNVVEAANGDPNLRGGDKLWWIKNGAGVADVRAVFAAFNWPNTTEKLMLIIEYGFKLAEEHSSIPLITQGQSGKTTPDTFGGQQLQDNNANQLLRAVGFGLNDTVTTPLVDQFYEWLLLDPDVPDEEKGDYQVDTSGALALIEKAIQDQTILAMGQLLANPKLKIDPARWFEAWARSKRLNPQEFQYSDAEWEKISSQPPPKDPTVEAAEIRAKAMIETAKSADALMAQRIKVDTDRDTEYVKSQERRDAISAEAKREELALRERIARLEYQKSLLDFANKREMSLQDAKVELSKTAMELRTQKELAGMTNAKDAEQVAPTSMEPAGQAPDGEAFQK